MKRFLRLGLFFLVTMLLGLLIAFTVLSWRQANAFVFAQDIGIAPTPANYSDIEFLSPDGLKLRGWYLAPSREDGASFLFVHGHGGNRNDFINWANIFSAEGYGILLFDLRARGGSEGEYVTMGVLEAGDVVAAFNFLSSQEAVNPERIAIFGHSMGGATTILATAQLPEARIMIASSAYSSVRNILNDRIPTEIGIPPLFFPDMIVAMSSYISGTDYGLANPLGVVAQITQPSLFITGTIDNTVPPNHSQILYDAANEPKELHWIEGANHNGVFELRMADYMAVIRPFVERYLINN
jgi:dipeptidyl aminopeptidase/acylaminoacyl peptidase